MLALLNKAELAAATAPQTTEDFIEAAAADEESGDRWHGLDLAKALRFYQKAFSGYQAAISFDNSGVSALQDAYYNAVRLLFQVYSQYFKTDGVDVARLHNVGEVLTGDSRSVVQPIFDILTAHERALSVDPEAAAGDLYFNTALVYTDAIEETDDPALIETYWTKGRALFLQVLHQQTSEFQEFLEFAKGSSGVAEEATGSGDPQNAPSPGANQQYTSEKTVQPPDVLDTVISGLGLCQTVLESVDGVPGALEHTVAQIRPFALDICLVAQSLLSEYADKGNSGDTDVLESPQAALIDHSHAGEYYVVQAYVQALSVPDLAQVYEIWDSPTLPNTPQRYMLAADSIETVLHRHGINADAQSHADVYWAALTKMNLYYKQALELLNSEYSQQKTKLAGDTSLGVGELIARIASVYIARSDIDVQRSQLHHEQAVQHADVLLNNSKAFLKNAMNLAKVSGGIREKAVEKAQRERKRYEAVSRLCVLEGKTDPADLNSILGPGNWESEVANYHDLWYFHRFF